MDSLLLRRRLMLHFSDIPQPPDYSKKYLTFTALTAGRINVYSTPAEHLRIRYNEGSWSRLPMSDGTYSFITVSAGDTVEFRGDGSFAAGTDGTFCTGTSSATYNISGNIMSLQEPENYTEAIPVSVALSKLFYRNTSIVDATNLVLPATVLNVAAAYSYMFRDCTNLVSGPTIGAINWANSYPAGACMYMFRGCSKLQRVKVLCSGRPELIPPDYSTNTFSYWMTDVSPTGTFVKATGADWNSGESGIPDNWVIEEV